MGSVGSGMTLNSAYHLARFKINGREEAEHALGGGHVQEHGSKLKTQTEN